MSDLSTIRAINSATGYTPTGTGNPVSPLYKTPSTDFASSIKPAPAAAPVDPYAAEIASLLAQSKALQSQLAAQPKLLPYDYTAAQAQAKAAAANAVNPLYSQKFNDFIKQAQVQQERQQADTNTANSLLEQNLTNLQQANATSGQRVGEDTQTNLDQLANTEQNFQQDTGTAADQARIAAARTGNIGSGIDTQNAQAAIKTQNTAESRQQQSFDVQAKAQQLFKSRSFEDLARSNELGLQSTTQGKTANNLSLARYIADYGTQQDAAGNYTAANTKQSVNALEEARQAALLTETNNQGVNAFNKYVASLTGARAQDISATRAAYGY